MPRDSQSRKWLGTLEEPFNKECSDGVKYTADIIIEKAKTLKSLAYCILSQEVGGKTNKHHIHFFMAFKSGVRLSTLVKLFPKTHFDACRGTSSENRDYVSKSGKWENDEKHGTLIPGSIVEWGECPTDRRGGHNDLADLVDMVKDGATNKEIRDEYPGLYLLHRDKLEKIRQELHEEAHEGKYIPREVVFVYGATATGKSRYLVETYGPKLYRITSYAHPFDGYVSSRHEVIAFEDFIAQIKITDMLQYTDNYVCQLPARYTNRLGTYKKVFIVSNFALDKIYKDERLDSPEVWAAFLRRINKVWHFKKDGTRTESDTSFYKSLLPSDKLPRTTKKKQAKKDKQEGQ